MADVDIHQRDPNSGGQVVLWLIIAIILIAAIVWIASLNGDRDATPSETTENTLIVPDTDDSTRTVTPTPPSTPTVTTTPPPTSPSPTAT